MRFSKALISSVCLSVSPMSSSPSSSRVRSEAAISNLMSGPPGPLMVWVSRSTVNGAAPFAAITRFSNAAASAGASVTGSRPFCRQFSR